MEKTVLKAGVRKTVGKKVKNLRKSGLLPANLFGKGLKSVALELPVKDFLIVYSQAGETGLVELLVDGKTHHTLISGLQVHPVTRYPLHAEFHAVSLTEKLRANVPLILENNSPAVTAGIGLLLQTLNEVEVEALPTDLPERIVIDAGKLTEVDQQITVGGLTIPKGVSVLTPAEEIVVRVAPAVSEEAKKEAEAAAAAEAAKAAEEAAGETVAEATPKPESPNEEKSGEK